MKIVIELKNVWKIYKMGKVKVPALRGVNLQITKGEFAAIMGKSGSGKSTLMYQIGALDLPTKGQVLLDGQDISKLSESDLATIRGQKIGFVFQTFNLLPNLNALENVMLPMTFQGKSESFRKKRATELLEMVDLKDRMTHKPNEMSGGEQQRVAIARALANDPEIILADEPTGNLDSKTGKQVMEVLTKLHKKLKKTIIVVTHDPYIAMYAKDEKAYTLNDGTIVKDHIKSKAVLWGEVNKK